MNDAKKPFARSPSVLCVHDEWTKGFDKISRCLVRLGQVFPELLDHLIIILNIVFVVVCHIVDESVVGIGLFGFGQGLENVVANGLDVCLLGGIVDDVVHGKNACCGKSAFIGGCIPSRARVEKDKHACIRIFGVLVLDEAVCHCKRFLVTGEGASCGVVGFS